MRPRLASCWLAALIVLGTARAGAATLFPTNAVWKYLKGQTEASLPQVAAWRRVGFDDASWSAGPASFFYGEPLSGTPLNDMANNYTCVFLRQKFAITDPYEFGALTLSVRCDDGYIAWINGVEVARYNLTLGFVPYFGLALVPVAEPAPYIATNIFNPSSLLIAGTKRHRRPDIQCQHWPGRPSVQCDPLGVS